MRFPSRMTDSSRRRNELAMRKGWTETTLGEVADVIGGGTPSTTKPEYWGGEIVWLTPTEVVPRDGQLILDSERRITDEGLKNSGAQLLPVGSVILTSRASVGFVGIAGVEMCTNQGFQSLVPGDSVLAKFLMYWIQSNRAEFESRAAGSTFKEISKSNVKSIAVFLPPLSEQRRIVDVVSSVDSYIDALRQQADVARDARNAVLHELLSAGGDDWTETTLGEIGQTGLFVDGDWVESKDQDPAGEFRLLQLADVGDGVFLDKSNRWMNSEQFSRLRCTFLHPRDILIARMPNPIARACVLPSGLPTCATVVDVAILRCGEGFVPEFVALVINDSAFRARAQSLLIGTTRQRISRSNLAKIVLVVPSVAEQERIVATVSSTDKVIQSTEQAVSDAKTLRSGLLSNLLSGEHEIPESYDRLLGAA